jgi:YHS domain-containing protein
MVSVCGWVVVAMIVGTPGRLAAAGCGAMGGCCASGPGGAAPGQHEHNAAPAAHSAKAANVGDPYLLATDPVSGEKLGPNAVAAEHEGRQLRFASKQSAERFQADPKAYLAKLDKQIIEQQKPLYPLKTCVVTDEKLGDMGKSVDGVYRNRLVRFCCADCQGEFGKDPGKYLKKLDEAVIKAQKATYPLKKCVVTGEALGSMGDSVDYVAGNRLVRFCCSGCIDKFRQSAATYLQKLDAGKEHAEGQGGQGVGPSHGASEGQSGQGHQH